MTAVTVIIAIYLLFFFFFLFLSLLALSRARGTDNYFKDGASLANRPGKRINTSKSGEERTREDVGSQKKCEVMLKKMNLSG